MIPANGTERQLLLLAGGGHTHALLLRRWLMRPALRPPATAVMLVSRHGQALYSGMVPGVVAGLYRPEQAAIDLRQLCRRAGVRFLQAEIVGVDAEARWLHLQGRPPLRFDRLSLDVGAVTAVVPGEAEQAVKPLEPFLAWVQARAADGSRRPLRLRGGGAAAVELALAFRRRGLPVQLLLRGSALSLGSAAANRRGLQLLREAGIELCRDAPATLPADLACTGSRAPAWLAASGLPVEPCSGRVLTEASLLVRGHAALFACGDCAQIAAAPRPPSGVWAVRAAPVLADNLRRSLAGSPRPLRPWRPQPVALQLLTVPAPDPAAATRALALFGPLQFGPSRWLWIWKDRIDRRFMAGFSPRAGMAAAAGSDPEAMVCRGCAAKLPAAPLASALARLQGGGAAPAAEDAASVLGLADGSQLLQSVDGFPALVDDPWLNGRLTTLHACSDLWACGASVQSAQVVITLPQAAAALQEELLVQSLAGVRSVLDPLGATLLGGHTLEGRDGAGLTLALTVNGVAPADRHWRKGPLRPGQVLLLTRGLGSGVLFAAAMAGAAPAAWLEAALAVMQQDQSAAVAVLARHGCRACTDVTGFGLLGHLGEMLGPGLRVELEAGAIPTHAGALHLLADGYASSLAPANGSALALMAPGGPVQLRGGAADERAALEQVLIDPQTCGPLLAAVPADRAAEALTALQASGFAAAALIGRVGQA